MQNIERRILALEARNLEFPDLGSASRVYAWCAANGLEVPAPTDGQALTDWLSLVPAEVLGAILDRTEAH